MGSLSHHSASFVLAHGLSCPVACGILVPRPQNKPTSPALQGRFVTSGPPGKPPCWGIFHGSQASLLFPSLGRYQQGCMSPKGWGWPRRAKDMWPTYHIPGPQTSSPIPQCQHAPQVPSPLTLSTCAHVVRVTECSGLLLSTLGLHGQWSQVEIGQLSFFAVLYDGQLYSVCLEATAV